MGGAVAAPQSARVVQAAVVQPKVTVVQAKVSNPTVQAHVVQSKPSGPAAANGHTLHAGDRIQTQWTRDEGGDNYWYSGTVTQCFGNGQAHVKYDDGDQWTGSGLAMYKIPPDHHNAKNLRTSTPLGQGWLPQATATVLSRS